MYVDPIAGSGCADGSFAHPTAQGFEFFRPGQTGDENIVTAGEDTEPQLKRGQGALLADKIFRAC